MEILEIYKAVLPYLFLSVFLLFGYHSFGGYLLFRKHKERNSIFHIMMCTFSSLYGLLFFLIYAEIFPSQSLKLYFSCWLMGFASYLSYINLIKWYLKLDSRFFIACRNLLVAITGIYLIEGIVVWTMNQSFLMRSLVPDESTPLFFRAIGIHSEPSVVGLIVGGLGALAVVATALLILKNLLAKHPDELLLKLGIVLSMCVGMNDILLGLGIFPWAFAMVYFGNAFEAVRFTNYYQELSYRKIGVLQDELSKVAKLAHVGFVASSINHDIMNPLAVIQTANEVLEVTLEEVDDDLRTEKYTNLINKNVARIKDIIGSYTALVRHDERGKVPFTSVEDIIADAVELGRSRIHKHGVAVTTSIEHEWQIEANLSDISLVMTNLINNACDAVSSLEDRWVRVSAHEDSKHLLITVTDSGGGIDPSIREKIFDLQFSTKKKGEGTGLGLGIVREIVNRYGYELYVNAKHENTQFVISVPKNHVQIATSSDTAVPQPSENIPERLAG